MLFAAVFIWGCGTPEAPLDKNGNKPSDVLLTAYTAVVNKDFDSAKLHFSDAFIKELITDKNISFEKYCENATNWQVSWLKTKPMGNDYNDNVWRAKIIPDEGKGAENGPGIVHDFHLIDGVWKVVFWGHYPKS